MSTGPTVGVVMTAYNGADFIAEALDSLHAQTMPDWECVVVDDGSTDCTAAIVEDLAKLEPRIRLVRQANSGVSQARTAGIAALGENVVYVALLDSDDRYVGDALAHLVTALDARPDAVGAFGLAEYMGSDGQPIHPGEHSTLQQQRRVVHGWRLRSIDPGADSTFADLSVNGAIWPAAVGLHRLAVVRAVGGFDPIFTRQGDWDLYLRMSRMGPFVMVLAQIAWYRRHAANLTGDVVLSSYARARVRRKAWQSADNTAEQRRIVARAARRVRLVEGWRLMRRLILSARTGRMRPAARSVTGLVVLGTDVIRRGPARPSVRRVRLTSVADDLPR